MIYPFHPLSLFYPLAPNDEHMDDSYSTNFDLDAGNTATMGSPIDEYAGSVLFSFIGVLAFVACVVCGMWFYRLYTTRGFHLTDFERLSVEARSLAQETSIIRKDIESDYSSDLSVKILNMARVNAADELDIGIRVALSAWEDIMQPDEGDALDEEDGVGGGKLDSKGQRRMRERRKSHGRYVIGLMRAKCVEGIGKRKNMSQGLQAMHLEVLSRKVDIQSSRINRRLAGGSKHSTPRKAMPERFRSLSHTSTSDMNEKFCASSSSSASATPRSIDTLVPQSTSTELSPSPSQRSASCPVPDDEKYEMMGPARKEYNFV